MATCIRGPGTSPIGNCHLHIHVRVHRAFRFQVANRGKSMLQRDPRISRAQNRAIRNRFLQQLHVVIFRSDIPVQHHVGVRIHESRQHRVLRQVHHFRARGHPPPEVTDTIVSPSITITAFSMTLSLLPSIKWPARTAIFFAGAEPPFLALQPDNSMSPLPTEKPPLQ